MCLQAITAEFGSSKLIPRRTPESNSLTTLSERLNTPMWIRLEKIFTVFALLFCAGALTPLLSQQGQADFRRQTSKCHVCADTEADVLCGRRSSTSKPHYVSWPNTCLRRGCCAADPPSSTSSALLAQFLRSFGRLSLSVFCPYSGQTRLALPSDVVST